MKIWTWLFLIALNIGFLCWHVSKINETLIKLLERTECERSKIAWTPEPGVLYDPNAPKLYGFYMDEQ